MASTGNTLVTSVLRLSIISDSFETIYEIQKESVTTYMELSCVFHA